MTGGLKPPTKSALKNAGGSRGRSKGRLPHCGMVGDQ